MATERKISFNCKSITNNDSSLNTQNGAEQDLGRPATRVQFKKLYLKDSQSAQKASLVVLHSTQIHKMLFKDRIIF